MQMQPELEDKKVDMSTVIHWKQVRKMHNYGLYTDSIGVKCRIAGSAETAGIYGGICLQDPK